MTCVSFFTFSFHIFLAVIEIIAALKMSWNHTPPPSSPRKPKIQQQPWEETPSINLYDPNREFYESSPNMQMAGTSTPNQAYKKSLTNQTRKINYAKYCLPNPMHQMSDPGTYYNMSPTNQKSPKLPNTPTFDFELSVTPKNSHTPLKSVTSNRRYYEDTSTSDLTPTTLMSSRKYEFGAVSPKFDNPGMCEAICNPINFNFYLLSKSIIQKLFSCLPQAQRNLNIVSQQRHHPKLKTQM